MLDRLVALLGTPCGARRRIGPRARAGRTRPTPRMAQATFASLRHRAGRCDGHGASRCSRSSPRDCVTPWAMCRGCRRRRTSAWGEKPAPRLAGTDGPRRCESPQHGRRARALSLGAARRSSRRCAHASRDERSRHEGRCLCHWLARGRTHQHAKRPADAIPCFHRAAREAPHSPVPHFHLGEVLWQLGLTTEALQAWRTAAQPRPRFPCAAPRTRRSGDGARRFRDALARRASKLPRSHRTMRAPARRRLPRALPPATAKRCASAAAFSPRSQALPGADAGRRPGRRARAVAGRRRPRRAPRCAGAAYGIVAGAIARCAGGEAARRFRIRSPFAAARWPTLESLRRLAVALHTRAIRRSRGQLAEAYCALCGSLPRPVVPLLWPRANGRRRIARGVAHAARPTSAAWEAARSALAKALQRVRRRRLSFVVLCSGDADGDALPPCRRGAEGRPLSRASAACRRRRGQGSSPRAIATSSSMPPD